MIIDNKYKFGQVVYLITDQDQCKRIVCGIVVKGYSLLYELAHMGEVTTHYDFEISTEKTYCN
jgi:hypothetical protein